LRQSVWDQSRARLESRLRSIRERSSDTSCSDRNLYSPDRCNRGLARFSPRVKGTTSHQMAGWVFVALMLTVAISSLWIPRFLHLTWIHVFTLVTLVSLPLALWHIRHGNVRGHAAAMRGLYIGGLVVAGLFDHLACRTLRPVGWGRCTRRRAHATCNDRACESGSTASCRPQCSDGR
jgi:uncharacterized membrane protein